MFVSDAASAFFQSSGSAPAVSASESRSAFIGRLSFRGVREPFVRQCIILGERARITKVRPPAGLHMNDEKPIPCGLCGRGFPDKGWLTKHHCLPKSKGGTSDDVALICSQ